MQEQDNIKTPSAIDQHTRRQSSDIEDTNPDTKTQTVSSIPPKTAATASKSAPIFSDFQNAEQSHETYISNQIREQLVQLGLSKEDIENKYERYILSAARAIIERSNEQAEALCSLYHRLVNDWETTAAETFGEMENSNRDDVTLEQEPNIQGGSHPICPTFTQIESTSVQGENFFTLAADPDMESQTQSCHDLTETEDTDLVSCSYVAETISQEEQTKIGDALVKAAALTTDKYRLNESISDISAAFFKLARVLGIKCGENEDYFLVLFEIWRNLVEK